VSTIILIPARMASTRLPGKPLADIAGRPMIVRVWERAMAARLGPVVVAAGEKEIADAVRAAGGEAILTDPNHASGSDRIFEALGKADPGRTHDIVLNLQGDLPTIDPKIIRAAVTPIDDLKVDIGTLATEISDPAERTNPNVTKAIVAWQKGERIGRALYFSRSSAPWGEGPLYHHIGIYAYRRAAIERFVKLEPSPLEKREKLEQLRALENGLSIGVARVDTHPLGVDTQAELDRARTIYSAGG
jgi:3-deoxy-manno-octulosonate cytidylyltransferase (CMP-KDO synthetase)